MKNVAATQRAHNRRITGLMLAVLIVYRNKVICKVYTPKPSMMKNCVQDMQTLLNSIKRGIARSNE